MRQVRPPARSAPYPTGYGSYVRAASSSADPHERNRGCVPWRVPWFRFALFDLLSRRPERGVAFVDELFGDRASLDQVARRLERPTQEFVRSLV